jgi:hypothetical protein
MLVVDLDVNVDAETLPLRSWDNDKVKVKADDPGCWLARSSAIADGPCADGPWSTDRKHR